MTPTIDFFFFFFNDPAPDVARYKFVFLLAYFLIAEELVIDEEWCVEQITDC